uniref:ATP synthase complex subunit 8 n=3 Tax=Darevskia TaxID=122330 RepID=A0A6B7FGZ8_9SAUR|nr:ATP synthase F0 subunit 8 [Darevskia armeniaca]YP_009730890.1 ATP synthase F0 subunit 8 [Darevskia dahli]YP_009730903.1 ATP synthase F0 subunit 8 [Darevskia mixta]QBA55774.1 ATP synthase F0 subunit 8 [Darevskia armeniaca]QBA55787.1 ATP synthase F0 subunit 8 [Darevskia dahli]QBA55800.1 ATP synthase F0 subunit 8 [Darevskia mixta]
MPQLNPNPWFLIFLLAWLTLIMLFTKTLNNTPHLSTPHYNKQLNKHFWTWPWL